MLYKIILGKIKSAILMGLVMGLASSVMGSEITLHDKNIRPTGGFQPVGECFAFLAC